MRHLTKDQAADVAACRKVIFNLRALCGVTMSARERANAETWIAKNVAAIEAITGEPEPEFAFLAHKPETP